MKIKTFIIISYTNNGQLTHIVNAFTKKEAKKMASYAGAWDGAEVFEIDCLTEGCVFDSATV